MRILIAPDKFKGSLTAQQVCDAIEAGLQRTLPHAQLIKFPLADGGEGTQHIFARYLQGEIISRHVHDPLGRITNSDYVLSHNQQIAFIEMASASGLNLLKEEERNPMKTSTIGTGELILDALKQGAKKIFLGVGGTATNDGAMGAASVFGYKFVSQTGEHILPRGENLVFVHKILTDAVYPTLRDVKITTICDVVNPLSGVDGAAYTYAPQKGATVEQVLQLDRGLQHFANIIKRDLSMDIGKIPGAGAGGGFGGGSVAFFNATLKKGVEVIFEVTEFEQQVRDTDLIITGEGRLDKQTLQGKLVQGVCALAKKYNKKVVCLVGQNELLIREWQHLGCEAVFSITEHTKDENVLQNAYGIVEKMVAQDVATWIGNNC